jgi:hypothetical protein
MDQSYLPQQSPAMERKMDVEGIASQEFDRPMSDLKSRDVSPDAPIADVERSRRKKSVDFARASVELEGFRLDKGIELLSERFVGGEIEIADLVAFELSRIQGRL